MLSPLQRGLLLSLKAAREEFEEYGSISEDSLAQWSGAPDVPSEALVENLQFLGTFAKSIMVTVSRSKMETATMAIQVIAKPNAAITRGRPLGLNSED